MRKLLALLTASTVIFASANLAPSAQAASPIRIFIDGQVLQTREAPVAISGYTMVPLRGIFEALNARVQWNQKTQTITATKRDTTIVLTLGAKTATINDRIVSLDSPARAIRGSTMVPVRFVSESLGDDVVWDKLSQSVLITTKAVKEVGAASSLAVTTVSQFGDGRDLQIGFTPPSDQSNVSGYRLLVVKAENASSFNLAKAQTVGSSNYTLVPTYNAYQRTTLSAQTRDVDGALLRANQAYRVFVLSVGQDSFALSGSSASISLTLSPAVTPATNVKIEDVGDYGDGRDMRVTFTKASNESNITGYRVMIVKTGSASAFNLAAANGMSSSNYTTVSKTGNSTLSVTLSSSARDTSGTLIKSGEAYTAFVLALSSNTGNQSNALSTASSSVTLLNSGVGAVTNLAVSDIADYNNGRDLQVSFTKAADETPIRNYRIFVVKEGSVGNFNLSTANAITNTNYYTTVNKTNGNVVQALSSSARDVDGALIQNGVNYRVFVMSVGNATGNNALSYASMPIQLSNNNITAPTNLALSDISDYGNGQDLRVSFTKPANENNIAHYRVYVVKENAASYFNLNTANANANYTVFYKSGGNISLALNADSRDSDGALIQNGLNYKVFVLSVGVSSAYGNALSSASATIKLANNGTVTAVTNVTASDVGDNNNGQDLRVAFKRATVEANISHYRIFVVPDAATYQFNLNVASGISDATRYSTANIGSDVSQVLAAGAKDFFGQPIQNGMPYRVYVLSVGYGVSQGVNALSLASPVITLTSTGVPAAGSVTVGDVGDAGNGTDMQVVFGKAVDETNIREYRLFVVKDANAAGFQLNAANAVTNPAFYTVIAKNGGAQYVQRLAAGSLDVNGEAIKNGVGYRVFILSVANSGTNALSASSAPITLATAALPAPVVGGISLIQDVSGNLNVSYTLPAGEVGISQYAVFAVKTSSGVLTEASANASYTSGHSNFTRAARSQSGVQLSTGSYSFDFAPLAYGETYQIYVLSIADGVSANTNKLSAPSAVITLAPPQQANQTVAPLADPGTTPTT